MKRLFLCSSFADVANLLIDFANEDLKGKIIAFIPTASLTESIRFYVKTGKKALEKVGMIVEEVEITQFSNEEISSILHKCDYIYITGGNTFFLLQELKRKGIDKIISEQVKSGKLYIGESAGAIIASPDTEYMKNVNFDPIEKAPELEDYSSLGLVDFYTIPHYGNFPFKKKGEKVIQLYNEKLQLIPISNKQAIFIEDSNIQIKDAR
ncbi:Type 1 glutamine amidotransferase-like domain-containing protein [Bacteroides hominis (ex Liu et al. 2022)]|uniref:Type 1 glutamine amidotransferase-like domain-containing protein n=1 Tax=Bacteroides TaxID=816 RepID=UPI0004D7BCBF|nr:MULTISPECIES: Type 1 glutamine amidotransferase-like domain-containing protein [Bacteroides]MBY2904470.1 peptidase S51 [Bacteroides fragilis]MCE8574019.1 Type 1 glutamine amidotransferase-like domain-containing protein [Bacteroides fragilis]MDV6143229.1 Type 1 glutamine amidotransferase-like domain-containing protein [Bacteroides hominis (ex Liu et al. 2022)]QCQ34135.1 peptidase S51 [Bacteroides fragilis]UHZ82859.1 Type 1 glutamine amidotransferase-like domain-containing protein [Bacteroide